MPTLNPHRLGRSRHGGVAAERSRSTSRLRLKLLYIIDLVADRAPTVPAIRRIDKRRCLEAIRGILGRFDLIRHFEAPISVSRKSRVQRVHVHTLHTRAIMRGCLVRTIGIGVGPSGNDVVDLFEATIRYCRIDKSRAGISFNASQQISRSVSDIRRKIK